MGKGAPLCRKKKKKKTWSHVGPYSDDGTRKLSPLIFVLPLMGHSCKEKTQKGHIHALMGHLPLHISAFIGTVEPGKLSQ